jgi:protein-disulfide isomerase
MNKSVLVIGAVIVAIGAAAFIPGVPKTTDLNAASTTQSKTAPDTIKLDELLKTTHGFQTGPLMANKKVLVFFDPSCPHCKDLWNANLAVNRQDVSVKWVPVGVLNPQSVVVASKLLSAEKDNAKAIEWMTAHEQSFEKGGLSGEPSLTEQYKGKVRVNSEALTKYATSIPFVITEINGKVYTAKGGMTPPMWNSFIETGVVGVTQKSQ